MKFCLITLIVGGPYYKVLDTSITDTTDVPQEQMEEDNKKAKKGSQDIQRVVTNLFLLLTLLLKKLQSDRTDIF